LRSFQVQAPEQHRCRHYLRFTVRDRPGVLARIAGVLGAFDVSIEQMVQEGRGGGEDAPVTIVVLSHECREGDLRRALAEIDKLDHVVEATRALRVEGG
jgi:homoserine dehydrogenase